MKIKLIAPNEQSEDGLSSGESFKIQRVSLPLLAALTPDEHSVKIVDEAFAPDDVNEDVDLVGISVMTDIAGRAYEIGDKYRERGVRVVMGGIHATVLPTEALEHADAVVIGEGEEAWPMVVADVVRGKMGSMYRSRKVMNLGEIPAPRHDLYPKPALKSYTPLAIGIETGRGCPYNCEFCSIGNVMGRKHRDRGVRKVIDEIERMDFRHLFIVDDAVGLNKESAKRLFMEMGSVGVRWAGQGMVSLAEDVELLRLMKLSGCVGVLVGFESVQSKVNKEMGKMKGLRIDFVEAMRRFSEEGIAILGSFIFGFDHESKEIFEETFEFIMKCKISGAIVGLLRPLPGTALYMRLLREGRLFDKEWWLHGHTADTLLFEPKGMSGSELVEGVYRLGKETYSWGAIAKRFFGMSPRKRTALGCLAYGGFSLATRRRYLKVLNVEQPFV